MPKGVLTVTGKEMKRMGDTWVFTVKGNSIPFRVLVHNSQLTPEKVEEINAQFANSLRYVKHYGGIYDSTASQKDVDTAMNKLTQTNYGIGIKVKNDPLPEFIRFALP